nr:MAG TPA: hypothetical protein [Caudoviricetes sp.]
MSPRAKPLPVLNARLHFSGFGSASKALPIALALYSGNRQSQKFGQ